MGSDDVDDVVRQAAEAVEDHERKLELEAARDLIRDALPFLPWELQDLYARVVELNNAGKRIEAGAAWDEWMAMARTMNLI